MGPPRGSGSNPSILVVPHPGVVVTLTRDPAVADGAIAWPVPDGDIPATGKPFAVDMGIFWTLDPDDLIAGERAHLDATGMLAQLGLIP